MDGSARRFLAGIAVLLSMVAAAAFGQTITTVAGHTGTPAFLTTLAGPNGVVLDSSRNVFISDTNRHQVLRVDALTGAVTKVAGSGNPSYFGDGGLAVNADLNFPGPLALDGAGNLYICDQANQRIRRVALSTGIISTVAGNGTSGYNGDGIAATSASLSEPFGIAIDAVGDLYIADRFNHRIRKVSMVSGVIDTIAGTGTAGYSGDSGPATAAELQYPAGVAIDFATNVYIADTGNQRVRVVAGSAGSTGDITTVAGNGIAGYSGDGGDAANASLQNPWNLMLAGSGDLYIADSGNDAVRKVTVPGGVISTVLGPATLSVPKAIAFSVSGDLFVTDATGGGRVRELDFANFLTTFAGNGSAGFSGDGGPAVSALLNGPRSVAMGPSGDLFIADQGNSRVRRIDAVSGIITTFAGNGSATYSGDGGAATAAGMAPWSVGADAAGNVYVADGARVRKVAAGSGIITTVAGTGVPGFAGDGGLAVSAELSSALTIRVDGPGNIYIADGARVRKVDAITGKIATVAGNGVFASNGDGLLATDASIEPNDTTLDAAGNLYIVDDDQSVRKVAATTGVIGTVAGGGLGGDGGLATAATLDDSAMSAVLDASGNLYIAEGFASHRVRMVSAATGIINTVVGIGFGVAGFGGDGGPALAAQLSGPRSIVFGASGDLFIADLGNNAIRKVQGLTSVPGNTPAGTTVNVQLTTPAGPVDVTFSNVTVAGQTTASSGSVGPVPPGGLRLGTPPVYYEITTTAVYSGSVRICLTWTEGQFQDESSITMGHFFAGSWQNVILTTLDVGNNRACGLVTSLSPFALFEPAYRFAGFYPPVQNAPAMNTRNPGSAVPVKFSLGGFRGLDVFKAGYPKTSSIDCGTQAALGAAQSTLTAGGSTLSYDAKSDQYTYTWKTDKSWAGCRQLDVQFRDGTDKRANFNFNR